MLDASYYASLGLADVLDKVLAGQRLSAEDGMALFACPDITAVGALAHHARCRMHGDKTSYVVNRQINYTNVCVNGCVFCAFRRDREEDQGAFCLSTEEVLERLRADPTLSEAPAAQRGARAAQLLQDAADGCGVRLKLNKKPRNESGPQN